MFQGKRRIADEIALRIFSRNADRHAIAFLHFDSAKRAVNADKLRRIRGLQRNLAGSRQRRCTAGLQYTRVRRDLRGCARIQLHHIVVTAPRLRVTWGIGEIGRFYRPSLYRTHCITTISVIQRLQACQRWHIRNAAAAYRRICRLIPGESYPAFPVL